MRLIMNFSSVISNSVALSKRSEMFYQLKPEKILQLRRFREITLQNESFEDIFPPYALEIHPTSRCQLNCYHCSYQNRNKNISELSENNVENLFEYAKEFKVKSIFFSGGGDPLAWRNGNIAKFFAVKTPFYKSIGTNGCNLEIILDEHIVQNIDIIQISIKGYDESSFYSITNCHHYFHRIDNCQGPP